ncbi:MAG: DUF2062 domain-containing protein [Pontiellaceae bacterium]|nr:DUF2062 domain-containing protein [Pontiellaceae bacterium]MBN2783345.1 DUF2062 domain-containing protein [Pontiellaceae bacterium]
MITFKLIRKIGKILRGGAGRKEILLGTLFGVLIGFNPGMNFSLLLTLILALLFNANFSFLVLGAALGKLLSFPLAPASFHIGFFLIHQIGMESMFRSLCNAPVTALMDLNVYSMAGSLPLALVSGIMLGLVFGTTVVRVRQKMLDASQHEIIGKTVGHRISRFLLWLAFGKSKLSLDDEVTKAAPLLRKSGLILAGSVLVIALLMEFLLLDMILTKGLEKAISSETGAEVNIGKAHFSMARGELVIEGLQVTDPDKPTHNLVQIEQLTADLNVGDLLSRQYTIDLLAGSLLQHDVLRETPGQIYEVKRKPSSTPPEDSAGAGKSLEDYFAQAENWKEYGQKAYDYLRKSRENAEQKAKGETPEPSKEDALALARAKGYLAASADLVKDRPAWIIRRIEIDRAELGGTLGEQKLTATEVSSHPELNGEKTTFSLLSPKKETPTARIVLHFEDPSMQHTVQLNLKEIPLGENIRTGDSFPLDIQGGKADLVMTGRFSADILDLPFDLLLHSLKANVAEGESLMGMDSATATEVLSSMEQLEINGALSGSLVSPRISVDMEKLTANMKEALVAAGKKELSKRVDAEMEKAKDQLKSEAGKQLNTLLEGEEVGSVEDKAKNVLKKLF